MRKIVVFLPNWLGDLVMATPVLRAMRQHVGADAQIVGIMRPYLDEVLGGTDWLDAQWHFAPRSGRRELSRGALVRRMRAERFDVALLLTNSLHTAALAWLGRSRERIGYVRYGRGPLLTGKVYPKRAGRRLLDEPMVDYYLRLAEAIGCRSLSPKTELATTSADEASADKVWQRLGLRGDRRVVAMNCSGAYGGAKLWPVEHFAELAARVVGQLDHDVLVMCGPKERSIAREIVDRAGHGRVFSMADQPLGLGTAKACIGRCRLMVSTDSGPRHMAGALGLPMVTMFGPMLPVWSENPAHTAANLHLDLDCIGCHKRVCPLGHHRCMRELSVDWVFDETARLLQIPSQEAA
jgi:heptosyltransferase-2